MIPQFPITQELSGSQIRVLFPRDHFQTWTNSPIVSRTDRANPNDKPVNKNRSKLTKLPDRDILLLSMSMCKYARKSAHGTVYFTWQNNITRSQQTLSPFRLPAASLLSLCLADAWVHADTMVCFTHPGALSLLLASTTYQILGQQVHAHHKNQWLTTKGFHL